MTNDELKKYINALLGKSEEAYLMAIEIINKPTLSYRTEGFCFFICNAWELLLKAYLIETQMNIEAINYKNKFNRTIGLDECVEKVFTSKTDKIKNNILFIKNIRNKATHLILPEYDYELSPAFQRCLTNYNNFFKNHFLYYNLNEIITPFVALVNSVDYNNASSLLLNPANLLSYNEIISKIKSDDSLSLTLKLVATKKESEADVKYILSKRTNKKATIINVPKEIDKTHPYTTSEMVIKIKEILEISLGKNHGFSSKKFQDICKRKNLKSNQDYCYQFKYSKNIIYKYSYSAIEYICQLYISEYKECEKEK